MSSTKVIRLACQPQTYPWGKVGSDSFVYDFGPNAFAPDVKRKESTPYAELWMGTHPNGPAKIHPSSTVPTSSSLLSSTTTLLSSYLTEHPDLLGVCADINRFPIPAPAADEKKGGEEHKRRHLPFLFKILTCKQALPLQIHPDLELAKELHKRDPSKFSDWNHKPEIAVALTPFLGFAGFLPFNIISSALRTVPELSTLLSRFPSYRLYLDSPSASTLKLLVKDVLSLSTETDPSESPVAAAAERAELAVGLKAGPVSRTVKSLLDRIEREGDAALQGVEWNEDERTNVLVALKKLNDYYAGDPGVLLAAFFMNLVALKPGEAIYVGADGAHAWLDGQIVELMATSDNVMNLAFVPPSEKDDVNIFVDAVTCEPKPGEAYKIQRSKWAKSSGSGATVYKVPTEEFSIYHVQQEGPVIIGGLSGPSVAIITATPTSGGKLTPRGEDPIDVERGMVFFIGAGTEVEYSGGVDAWAAFFDDEAQEQTGSMK